MKTSILITVYNRADLLRTCLQALSLQEADFHEVIVVDDGSGSEEAERTRAVIESCNYPARYLRQEDDGYRLAAARNMGIREAEGDYLLFIDCDILLLPDALAVHHRECAPGRLLVGNRTLLSKEESARLKEGLTRESLEQAWAASDRDELAWRHRKFMRHSFLRKLRLVKRHKPKMIGCHFSLFKEDLERINGFDEHYVGWGLEDDDLALRLRMSGCRSYSVIPSAHAMHLWHPSPQLEAAASWDSVNKAYFHRAQVSAYCADGLEKPTPPLEL